MNFATTDRHGIMPSLRLLRAVEVRRGDLKQHEACHDKIPTLGPYSYSTPTHGRAPPNFKQPPISLFPDEQLRGDTHEPYPSDISLLFTLHALVNDVRSFRFKTWSEAKNKTKKHMYTTPTCISIYSYLANHFRPLLHHWGLYESENGLVNV